VIGCGDHCHYIESPCRVPVGFVNQHELHLISPSTFKSNGFGRVRQA
jgi:hypothetical protein